MPVAKSAQRFTFAIETMTAACHVDGAGERDVRDLLGSVLGDERLELVEVDVALERVQALGVVHLGADHVDEDAAGASWCSRVVVKYMFPGTYWPGSIAIWLIRCSAPRPWWVGTTMLVAVEAAASRR